jgi:hypothetical protein
MLRGEPLSAGDFEVVEMGVPLGSHHHKPLAGLGWDEVHDADRVSPLLGLETDMAVVDLE